MGWQTSVMKQVFFQLKVVYNDDERDNRISAITEHVGQTGNEYAQPISTMDVSPML